MRRLGIAGLIIALCTVMIAAPAPAHTTATHYVAKWSVGADVFFRFEQGFPGGGFRDRVRDGAAQWTARGGTAEPDLYWAGGADVTPINLSASCSSSFQGLNAIHYQDLDYLGSGTLGVVYACFNNTTKVMGSFQFGIDNDRDWYTGTGDANDGLLNQCVPSCQDDLWSLTSHEFGHATGFIGPSSTGGHHDEADSTCPESDARSTMCPSIQSGTERQRSLEPADYNSFTAAY